MQNIIEFLAKKHQTGFKGFPVCKVNNNKYYALVNLDNENEIKELIEIFDNSKYKGRRNIHTLLNDKKNANALSGHFLVGLNKVCGELSPSTYTIDTIKLKNKSGTFISNTFKREYEILDDNINTIEDFEKYFYQKF